MLEKLKQLAMDRKRENNPSFPVAYLPEPVFTDKTANGLTKCVVAWIQLHDGQAERISNMGKYVDESKIVTDVLGHKRKIGSGKYIKGQGTLGTADVSATIKGKSVKIEIKMADKQSEAQAKYQANIERAGGIYFIVHNFNEFVEKWKQI